MLSPPQRIWNGETSSSGSARELHLTEAGTVESPRLIFFRLLSAYVRHVPPHRGHWRLANLAVKLSPLLKSAEQPTFVTLHEGFRLIVDGRSQTGRIAYATGHYEQRTTDLLKAIVRPGDTVIDVGANIG